MLCNDSPVRVRSRPAVDPGRERGPVSAVLPTFWLPTFVPAGTTTINPSAFRGRFYTDGRGRYRVFNAAVYRLYRSSVAPPKEADTPFATSATLPNQPPDTYADGTWFLSVSRFNGVLDSGFLPLGPSGETYLRLDIAAGAATNSPPNGPLDWRLEAALGGVVRVVAVHLQPGPLRATQWALTFTVDGSTPGTPPAVNPDVTVAMPTRALAVLGHGLPAQAHGATVRVRLQTRRLDGAAWVYSGDSAVLTMTADSQGPAAPAVAERWSGRLPEDL